MDLSKYTKEELSELIFDLKKQHDEAKTKIIDCVDAMDDLKNKINEYDEELINIENVFIMINKEIEKRK